ncbi:hypothetical protein [Qipengyuania sp. DGS5-3]|uniref:hypothetical protein n=1 Tax=Qipengyuania sp. DGS5-3 TaxID=3349632 RepID=UPI0036D3221C
MLTPKNHPADAYRRVEVDARVEGADGIGLTRIYLEHALDELDRASRAHHRGDRIVMSDALTRAANGIAGLGLGVSDDNPMREPLRHLYGSAETAVRASITQFRDDVITRVRYDLRDILALF